jgi:beta-fructofuranosidase
MITWQPDPTTALEVVLAEFPNGEEQTRIVFEPEMGELFVDRRHSNIRGDVDLDTQYARLDLGQGEALELRIFFDHSVIEVFANELVCLTSRIYPTLNGDLEVSFLSRHKDTEVQAVDVWELDSIW